MRMMVCLVLGLSYAEFHANVLAEDRQQTLDSSAVGNSIVVREEEKFVLQSLAKKITFECDGMPLEQALRRISEQIDCPIFVSSLIEREGIDVSKPVTLNIGPLTARQTLHFLLKPLSLNWVANDGVLEVTTQTAAAETYVARVYDIRKLRQFMEPLTREMIEAIPVKLAPPTPTGGGFFNVPTAALSPLITTQFGNGATIAQRMPPISITVEEFLIKIVSKCMRGRGGKLGKIQAGDGCLIVYQSYHNQFEIEGLLAALERLFESKVAGSSIPARRIGYPAEVDAAIFEALNKPRTVEIEPGLPSAAIDRILRDVRVPYWIDRKAIADEGIDLEAPNSARRKLQRLPLAICLKTTLDPLFLDAVVEEGVLQVTSQTAAVGMMSIRLYDISKISKGSNLDRLPEVLSSLTRATHGRWEEDQVGETGTAFLISPIHLAVSQTQTVHAEIALLIDELSKKELSLPADPPLETQVYTAPDIDTARDLERVLPELVQKRWSKHGSIHRAGPSLIINQPPSTHDQIDKIMDKLEQSYLKRNPPAKQPPEAAPIQTAPPND